MTDAPNQVLYIFVRTEMPSMTPGKAQAHSGHAANAFIFRHYIVPNMSKSDIKPSVIDWMSQTPFGFGTQINLKAPWEEVEKLVEILGSSTIALTQMVFDPTYPYIVDREIVKLIDPTVHTTTPVQLENGNYLCCRNEATAAYIFGDKRDLSEYLGKYPLHP